MALQRGMSLRTALAGSISLLALTLPTQHAFAQTAASAADIGSVDVQSQGTVRLGLPLSNAKAVGSLAPAGSAPALAPSQGSLDGFQPGSIVSDKVLRDIIPPSADYNESVKYTPGWISNNTNGLIGDAKGGWRGFVDGQYNITFDGIPFGDANDPTHHSAAYFPGAFLGSVTADRGPGSASQVGYATFGGTLGLNSVALDDNFGGKATSSFGSYSTQSNAITLQTGKIGDTGVRALFQFYNAYTAGALNYGKYNQNQYLAKIEKQFENFRVTVFANYGIENYNNVSAPTYPQWQQYGRRYGEINSNPRSQQYVGWNNSQKQTDFEYIDVDGNAGPIHVSNKVYTYSYSYPSLQNNGADQTIEGNSSTANGGTITSVSIPTQTGGKTKVNVVGVTNGDVVGYIKNNNYRGYGDILKLDHRFDAGLFSGTLRAGVWAEQVDNGRLQEYIDYTTGRTFPSLGNGKQVSYKLNLASHITNVSPFIEYEWTPTSQLTITPGFKQENFTRNHNAYVNQTTLQTIDYTHTYTANMPYIAANYKLTPELTAYAQVSQGFLAPTVSAYYVFNPADGGIKPQTTTNLQGGVVWKSDRITADADIYQITASNFPVTTNLSTGEQIYTNGGTAVYKGFEIEGSYAVVPGVSVYASTAAISAKYTSGQFNGQRVGNAPNYTFAGGVIYDDGMIFGSLLQKFTGDSYGSSGQKAQNATTNANLNYVKGYNTTDLVIGVRTAALHDLGVGKNAEIKLGVYNVFDHRNITDISGDPTGLTSINNTKLAYSFLPGRLVFGSISFGF